MAVHDSVMTNGNIIKLLSSVYTRTVTRQYYPMRQPS